MSRSFVFLCLAASVMGSQVADLGEVGGRIVGGEVVQEQGKYPSMGSLRYMNDHTCGCTIVNDHYVLTAASCVRVLLISSLTVHVGSNHVNGGGQNYDVGRVIEHPDFLPADLSTPDLALVRLPFPFVFTASVQPATLALQGQPTPTGSAATAVGWGFSAEAPPLSPSLLEVQIEVRDQQTCRDAYAAQFNLTDVHVCADVPEGGKGVCNMDQGGPLYVGGEQHGVISRKVTGCALEGYPGLYVRVAAFRDWIDENAV